MKFRVHFFYICLVFIILSGFAFQESSAALPAFSPQKDAPAGSVGVEMAEIWQSAGDSAGIAGYSLSKVRRWLHEVALKKIDPATGLYRADGYWNYRDTAADCYPFLCWAAFIVDKDAFEGPVRNVLHVEQKLCNYLDRIPVPYNFQKKGKVESISYDEMIFQASEYVKDGLVAIVEITGRDEWFDRMKGIEEDIWKHARYETPFGLIPSTNIEVNGEQLQVLSRLYKMTGDTLFLIWARRLADYYLTQENFVPQRLRDHGCEIIGGLGLLAAVETASASPRTEWYRRQLKRIYDTILEKGCNEDGMMYNHLTRRDGWNGRLSDGWGYNYVGYLCYDMMVGQPVYQPRVERTLKNLLKPQYDNYCWEGNYSIDGFADSLEGAIYLVNRLPVKEALRWIDREMARHVVHADEPLQKATLWGTMKLQSNGVRTVLMHALMHTRGLIARPWRQDLELGAVQQGEKLFIVMKSSGNWSGRLEFDIPRYRLYMGFSRDWPRMNTLPEWFTVSLKGHYIIEDVDTGHIRTYTGKQLHEGMPLFIGAGKEMRLVVCPQESKPDYTHRN